MTTDLTEEQYKGLLKDLAIESKSKRDLTVEYRIGWDRLNNIILKEQKEIEQLKCNYLDERRKCISRDIYSQIINDLDVLKREDKISKAKYGEITRGLKDLHQIARLEEGRSTDNVGLNLTQMNREDLLRFVYNSEEINLNESKSE